MQSDLALSIPCIVSNSGAERIVTSPLTDGELSSLRRSAEVIKGAIDELQI